MKLATLRNGRPDGQLIVVSSDLTRFVSAGRIAPTLQAALDTWATAADQLADLAQLLEEDRVAAQPFEPESCGAPLPRAYQLIGGAAYLGHLERQRIDESGEPDGAPARRPLLYQGASDSFASPNDPIVVPDGDLAADFEAELAVIIAAVPMRASKTEARAAIRLVGVCNDVSLRRLASDDMRNGFGFFHSRPATAFAPVVATPTDFGVHWANDKLSLRMQSSVNGRLYGQPDTGTGMQFDFADLIVAASQTRRLGAGTIITSGTIANRHDDALPIKKDGIGFAFIGEARTLEKARYGRARTPWLKEGDRVRIALVDAEERPVLGAIDQRVVLFRRETITNP